MIQKLRDAPDTDQRVLRRALQDAFTDDPACLRDLQNRAMAQWHMGQGHIEHGLASAVDARPVARLSGVMRDKGVQLGLASLALVLVVAWVSGIGRADPVLEELLEPDILSLIAAGEL